MTAEAKKIATSMERKVKALRDMVNGAELEEAICALVGNSYGARAGFNDRDISACVACCRELGVVLIRRDVIRAAFSAAKASAHIADLEYEEYTRTCDPLDLDEGMF